MHLLGERVECEREGGRERETGGGGGGGGEEGREREGVETERGERGE